MYDVKPVHEPDQLEQIYRLRVAAWRSRVPLFPAMEKWTDDYDNIAAHWAIWIDDEPVAAARLTIHDRLSQVPNAEVFQSVFSAQLTGPIAVLTRLVVRSSHANLGLSKLLDEVRMTHASAAGCRCIIGSTYAGQKRLAAMQALGFEIVGEAEPYQSGPLRDVAIGGGGERPPSSSGQPDPATRLAGPRVLIRQINPASGLLGSAYLRVPMRPAR